jgi:hypothetical protein
MKSKYIKNPGFWESKYKTINVLVYCVI